MTDTKELLIKNRRIHITVGIFILIMLGVGMLMQKKMEQMLQSYMIIQVTEQAKGAAELAESRIKLQYDILKNVADNVTDDRFSNRRVLEYVAEDTEGVTMGILRLNGKALNGEPLDFSDYAAIQDAFRGNSSMSYCRGKGLVFTMPVFHGSNVKYVVYKHYREDVLRDTFGVNIYSNQGSTIIGDYQFRTVVPGNGTQDVEARLDSEEYAKSISEIKKKLNIATAAAVFNALYNEYLYMAEIKDVDFYVMGLIDHEIVSSEVTYLSALVMWVFGLLMLLFIIGIIYLYGADEKARESDQLRMEKDVAEQANRAKSDFLANMSHEIRTPINAVLGLDTMILRESTESHIREYAQDIQNAGQNLLSLINDILDFSKIESGKMEIVDAEYDFGKMIHDIRTMLLYKAEAKQLGLKVQVDEKLPSVLYGDDVRIKQVLVNLLNNAVKYTEKGTVTLEVSGETADNEVTLHFHVKDTGIGIKEEDMPKLFTQFERIEEKRNRNIEGTGLGLSITAKLLILMDSKLEVSSVYGEGSDFWFDLKQKVIKADPVGDMNQSQTAAKDAYTYQESFVAPDAKVLVVDDNAINRKVFRMLLKKTQIQVDDVESGMESIELCGEKKYDIIFMDQMMPEMDGTETLHKMREIPDYLNADTPMIILTANAISGAREEYLAEGFDEYLSKPIVQDELEEMLRRFLPKELLKTP